MADERDVPSNVSQAYRGLGSDEPPRALDEAILAAARRPARPWARRWGLPVSIAAVVVLSLTVTLRIADEQPGLELPEPRREAPAKPAPAAQAPAAPPVVAESAKQEPPRARTAPRSAAPAPAAAPKAFPGPAAAPEAAKPAASAETAARELRRERAADAAVAGAAASRAEEGAARDATASRSAAPALAKLAQETPEQELERIARLRAEGRHEDADKALAEFRKRFPDYRIPEPMLQRVERR